MDCRSENVRRRHDGKSGVFLLRTLESVHVLASRDQLRVLLNLNIAFLLRLRRSVQNTLKRRSDKKQVSQTVVQRDSWVPVRRTLIYLDRDASPGCLRRQRHRGGQGSHTNTCEHPRSYKLLGSSVVSS